MTFGDAIEGLKRGKQITRGGLSGGGIRLFLLKRHVMLHEVGNWTMEPCIVMETHTGKLQAGWVPSQADMLADDWVIAGGGH